MDCRARATIFSWAATRPAADNPGATRAGVDGGGDGGDGGDGLGGGGDGNVTAKNVTRTMP